MYETLRIVEKIKPKYVIWENVKNILSKKHIHNFDNYLGKMKELGYTNYYQVLNAKDYGIPQNRERVFTVSIRNDCVLKGTYNYGIDDNDLEPYFKFPKKEELKLRLKDMLEDEAEEKYYLKDYQIENIKKSNFITNQRRIQEKDYCDTLCARDWKDPKCIQVGNLKGGKWDKINESCRRVYSEKGISPTIHTCQGGNTEPKIEVIGNYNPSEYDASRIVDSDVLAPTVKEKHGAVTAIMEEDLCEKLKYEEITQDDIEFKENSNKLDLENGNRIRKLTPKECWRLMGFDDESFEKARSAGISNTQLYKQARKFDLCANS